MYYPVGIPEGWNVGKRESLHNPLMIVPSMEREN